MKSVDQRLDVMISVSFAKLTGTSRLVVNRSFCSRHRFPRLLVVGEGWFLVVGVGASGTTRPWS